MELAVATPSVSDSDLAYQLQLNEALAASMGIDSSAGWNKEELAEDAGLAMHIQKMELESLQKQELDKSTAAKLVKRLSEETEQVKHDYDFACEIDEMSEDEWEENGDLYEKPFDAAQSKEQLEGIFRVFFKGYALPETAALGAVVMDAAGNQLVQLQRCVPATMGKTIAQYRALIDALHAATSLGARKIIAYTDCKPLYFQVLKRWKVTSKPQKRVHEEVMKLVPAFASFDLNLALHGENWPADNLSKMASISQRQTVASSSSRPVIHCIICLEDVRDEDIYTLKECTHKFCSSCVKQHVETSVTSGRAVPVACPNLECGKAFTEEECKALLSKDALEIFLKKVEEARIPEPYQVYCPYPNCSALMDKRTFQDNKPHRICKACKMQFCSECRVPWHIFSTCAGYQRLPPELKDAEDAKLYKLAENQNWRQCKQCRRMIELSEGCYHMTCRCGHEFCYICGADYRNKIQTCECKLWDEHNIIREDELDDEETDLDEDYLSDYSDGYDDDDSDDNYVDNLPPPPGNRFYKTQLCRYFERGHCNLGNNCNFAHGDAELRNPWR